MKRKYVIFTGRGNDFALVFPTFIQHNQVRVVGCETLSAGFVDISVEDGDFKVRTYGMSVSLKLKSRKYIDDKIVLQTINSALVI